MGAMPNEPSMEEILSSIKRIIAEEDLTSAAPRAPRKAAASVSPINGTINGDALGGTDADAADDQILELTDALPGEAEKPQPQASGQSQEEPIMSAPAKPAPAQPVNSAPQIKPEAKPARAEPRAPRARAAAAAAAPTPSTAAPAVVMSDDSARAARDSLVNLSKLLISPDDGQPNTLEGLVREMLRPMLKDWLDAHLPEMVETMVKREIDRITGRV